jgi:hypothetical protein
MKKDDLLTLPVILFSTAIVVFGILKFTIYKEPNFMVLIFIYFLLVFIMSMMLIATKGLICKILSVIHNFENFALILGVLYLGALIVVMICLKKKMKNDVYMSDYIFFLLMSCIVSCYNVYLYIRKLKYK